MAEPKKTRAKSPKTDTAKTDTAKAEPKRDLVEMAAVTTEPEAEIIIEPKPATDSPAPKVSTGKQMPEAGVTVSLMREQADALRQAMGESLAASAKGALEVSDKVIEALQSQSHAAMDLWRSAFGAHAQPEAFHLQASAARQAYETASAQWKDVAETAARWMTRSVEPFHATLQRPTR